MKDFLTPLISIAPEPALPPDEYRRVALAQLAGVIGLTTIVLFDLLYLVIDFRLFFPLTLTSAVPILLFLIAFRMNRKHRFPLAKIVLNAGIMLSTLMATVLFIGKAFSVHYYFLFFSLLPVLFWSRKQLPLILFFLLLNLGCFFFVQLFLPQDSVMIRAVPARWNGFLDTVSIFLIYLSYLGLLLLFQYEVDRDGRRLAEEAKNMETLMLKYEALSKIDPLTGLLNRRSMMTYLEEESSRVKRSGGVFSILMCDLDDFKEVNDSCGHACGDTVLVEFSSILRKSVRETDRVCRWGGEEFCILVPDTPLEGAEVFAERIREHIRGTEIRCPETTVRVTATIGISVHQPGDDLQISLRDADRALYAGKAQGKNCIVSHSRTS